MNQEEQAVLNFFAQPENLPLTLSVAEQSDGIRRDLNNHYWRELLPRLEKLLHGRSQPWHCALTEDRNSPDCLVGVHCSPAEAQSAHLRLILEQQFLGDAWRIYFGLMWSEAPTPEQLALPAVAELRQSLQDGSYRSNASFLGWQWTRFYPRRRDFLLSFGMEPDDILAETSDIIEKLLEGRHEAIERTNAALAASPRSVAISLDQLRSKM